MAFSLLTLLVILAQADPCDQLVSHACAPGTIDDGTGVTVSGGVLSTVTRQQKEALFQNEQKIFNEINPKSRSYLQSASQGSIRCLYQTLKLKEVDQANSCKALDYTNIVEPQCIEFMTPYLSSEMIGGEYSCFVPARARSQDHKNKTQCDTKSMSTYFIPFISNYSYEAKLPEGMKQTKENESFLLIQQQELDKQKNDLMNCMGFTNEVDFKKELSKLQVLGQKIKSDSKSIVQNQGPYDESKSNERLQATFKDVQSEMSRQIKTMGFDPKTEAILLEKITQTKVNLLKESCDGAMSNHDTQSIQVCAPLLYANTSYYYLTKLLGHELTHQIDSSGFAGDPVLKRIKNPFEAEQLGCPLTVIVDPKSEQTKINNEAFSDAMGYKVLQGLIEKKNPTATLEQKLAIYRNATRSTGEKCDEDPKGHDAGTTTDRITRLVNMGSVRQSLGCTQKATDPDCEFSGHRVKNVPQKTVPKKTSHRGI